MSDVKTTIFYYTNNLVPEGILRETLIRVMREVESRDDLELIVTSHYPVIDDCVDVSDQFQKDENVDRNLASAAVSGPIIKFRVPKRAKFFVVGALPQKLRSIFQQLQFSIGHAHGEHIIMHEHDVLYPDGYCDEMLGALGDKDFAVAENVTMLGYEGFFKIGNFYALSRYVGKKSAWKDFVSRTLAMKTIDRAEPVLKGLIGGLMIRSADNIWTYDSYEAVQNENPVLDVKHGLNACGNIISDEYEDTDDYWGEKEKLLDLIGQEHIEFIQANMRYCFGLSVRD